MHCNSELNSLENLLLVCVHTLTWAALDVLMGWQCFCRSVLRQQAGMLVQTCSKGEDPA